MNPQTITDADEETLAALDLEVPGAYAYAHEGES